MGLLPRVAGFFCLAVVAGGCGTADDADTVRGVTTRFYDAIREKDGKRACGLLSAQARRQLESQTGQKCDDVVTRLRIGGGRVESATVYVTNAKVDLSSGESAFLGLERDGWRITAVACRPQNGKPRDRPFECEAEA